MKRLSKDEMMFSLGGKWQEAVGCIGGTAAWVGSILGLAVLSAGTGGLGLVALGILSFEANGALAGISCAQWIAED